jgi:O-antigen chain-terminating methyltransferase
MTDSHAFYRAFEDRMRGSRELILKRLQVYRPFLEKLNGLVDRPAALDIGCGRGEWLEMLTDAGFDTLGIDLDNGMLDACRSQGLTVEQGDGIERLAWMADGSLVLVSAFHVVEHLPFKRLQELVKQARRVLCPGGLLIMETPNPENPVVGTHTFHLDPTHEKPLPPALLAFLPEFYGYHRTWIMRLQQERHVATDTSPTLTQVLFDVSPDYAVVAQTAAEQKQLSDMDVLFKEPLGLDLHTLSERFDTGLTGRFHDLETRFDRQVQEILVRQEKAVDQLHQDLDQNRRAHEQERDALAAELKMLYNSRSWRLTGPLRKGADLGRSLHARIQRIRALGIVTSPAFWILKRIDISLRRFPRGRNALAALLRKPGLNRLAHFYHNARMNRAADAWNGDDAFLDPDWPGDRPPWMSGTTTLSTEELLTRIRNEIRQTGNRNPDHDI